MEANAPDAVTNNVLGTRQVFFAVVTTTATLAAVFVPLSFLPGQAGGLFREFGFTLAIAVALAAAMVAALGIDVVYLADLDAIEGGTANDAVIDDVAKLSLKVMVTLPQVSEPVA